MGMSGKAARMDKLLFIDKFLNSQKGNAKGKDLFLALTICLLPTPLKLSLNLVN